MTGIETVLAPAIGKAAGAGAAKAGGWAISRALRNRRQKQTEEALRVPPEVLEHFADPDAAQRLLSFFEAPDISHFTSSLTQLYLIERSGGSAAELIENLENEFYYALASWLGSEPPFPVIRLLFAALNEAVLAEAHRLSIGTQLSPHLKSQIVQTVSSLAAASARNTALLRRLRDSQQVHDFQSEITAQIAALNGTMRLPHAGTTRQVPYRQLFVTPHLWIQPESESRASGTLRLSQIFLRTTRALILGDPGGGKSTLVRKFMHDVSMNRVAALDGRTPFFVTLKDFAPFVSGQNRKTLSQYIEGLCLSPYQIQPPSDAVEILIHNDRAVVILDGLDELLDVSLRRDVVEAVNGFASRYPTCPMIVTSRRVGYDEAPLDRMMFTHLELGSFNPNQVSEYVKKWFALDESITDERRTGLTEAFIADSQFVSNLRTNPLLLSLMCGIYASENYIPHNRPDVYEKCALLLFESWDKQRGIKPSLPFDAHVQSAMRSLALYMFKTLATAEGLPRVEITRYVAGYLREKRFDNDEEAENAAIDFINFCKGRAWVLTDIGAEIYGFTHRTFMEYFAASQLVRLKPNASALFAELEPHLRDESWDVVSQLALQILSRSVEDGADDFLELLLDSISSETAQSDLRLLAFASRSLEFIVPKPRILAQIVNRSVSSVFSNNSRPLRRKRPIDSYATLIHNASIENAPRVSTLLRDNLSARLTADPTDELALLMAIAIPKKDIAVRYSSSKYWIDWADENRDIYSTSISHLRNSVSWVARTEIDAGSMELGDGLRTLGPRILYDYHCCGVVFAAPLAFLLLQSIEIGDYSDDELIPDLFDSKAKSTLSIGETARILLAELPQASGYWLRYSKHLDPVARKLDQSFVIDDPVRSPFIVAAAILLAIPLIEVDLVVSAHEWNPGENAVDLYDALATARSEGGANDDLDHQLTDAFDGYPDALAFVRRWISGERTLVSHLPNRPALHDGVASEEKSD